MFFPPTAPIVGLYVLIEATGGVPSIDFAATCRAAHKAITAISKDAQAADILSLIHI